MSYLNVKKPKVPSTEADGTLGSLSLVGEFVATAHAP